MTRTRTWDPMINSHLLYRLSYHGTDISSYNVEASFNLFYPYASLRSCV
ncbi:OMP_b-brl_3 domain-containing protein [Pseudomonas brassicacearum]